MQATVAEIFDKVEALDGILGAIEVKRPLCDMDLDIVHELLDDYREILLHTKVKI